MTDHDDEDDQWARLAQPSPMEPADGDHFFSPPFPESPDLVLDAEDEEDDWPLPPSLRRAASEARLLKPSCLGGLVHVGRWIWGG